MTGVVTIIFLVAMTALASLTSEAASARARVRFTQRAMTTEAVLAYMIATEPFSVLGVNTGAPRNYLQQPGDLDPPMGSLSGLPVELVRFDGRPYVLDEQGSLVVSLRDQGGMINLAFLTPEQTTRLARRLSAAPSFDRWIRPRYDDYVDPDELERADGAEATRYGGQGPPNRNLLRTDEWLSIHGVREAINPRAWRALQDDLIVDHLLPRLNVNTASASAMQVLFGVAANDVGQVMAARETAAFLSYTDFAAAAGVPDLSDLDQVFTYPTGRVVAVLRDGASPWVYRSRLTLAPTGLERPVWIDQTSMNEAPRRVVADIANATRFPYTPR